MTTASPPAPSARILFFSPLRCAQPRQHAGRISTWPFRVVSDKDRESSDIRLQAARIIRTTAGEWWPPAD
ncbi:hypothetical protein [Variovorax sp. OV700]|uniref:hypothetical protein n=1 Tax=Variovorax sp. OV700 TaxID=1882826 RepID=UPI00088E6F36|nr:hypothetical protein [Variovorax sp. OV700]SDI48604.1 hypothetical protein SAMN05444748_105305 [Variovorax sp. OV700]